MKRMIIRIALVLALSLVVTPIAISQQDQTVSMAKKKVFNKKTVRSILDKLEDGLKLKKVKKIMKISLGKPTTEKVDVLGVGKRTYKHYYLRYYCKNTNVIVGFDPEKGYTKSPQANYIDVHLVFYKDKLWLWENKGGGYLIETQEEPPMTDFKEQ